MQRLQPYAPASQVTGPLRDVGIDRESRTGVARLSVNHHAPKVQLLGCSSQRISEAGNPIIDMTLPGTRRLGKLEYVDGHAGE